MKNILLSLLFAATSMPLFAAKANPVPFQYVQSDGTTLTVRLHGDEHFHWYSTLDGVLLSREGASFYVASVNDDGTIAATSCLAHDAKERSTQEQAVAEAQDKEAFFAAAEVLSQANRRREPLNTDADPSYFPHEGSPTAIVILVQYTDTVFTVNNPAETFERFLNGDEQTETGYGESYNYGSVRQYFEDMSGGVFSPVFELYGPVTVSHDMAYYGDNSGSTTDVNYKELVTEACALIDDEVDFSADKYDSDGDGDVDLVYVIYAGYGESNGADAATIWPKSGYTSFGTYDGKAVRRYGLCNELNATPYVTTGTFATPKIAGIGLFCHEFSHCLGLPDLYPTVTSARVDNQEMEYWSLMDGGEYVYYGYCPTAYTSWERETMEWGEITTLDGDTTATLQVSETGCGESVKFVNPADEAEYFVLECIQRTGWNSRMPGHGLLVYHVKWPMTTVSFSQHPNNTAYEPGMAVVPADGILISSYNTEYTTSEYQQSHYGDPFPGTSGVTELTYEQLLPNYAWYEDGPQVEATLTDIAEDTDAGTVTFTYTAVPGDTDTAIRSVLDATGAETSGRIYDINGIYVGDDGTALPKGVYVIGGKKTAVRR